MLGGSIGIAMTSAVLAVNLRSNGLSSDQLLGMTGKDEAPENIRKAYNDSFTEVMTICAVVAGIGFLLTLGTYRRGRVPLAEQRAQQVRDEIARRRAPDSKTPVQSTSSGQSS